MLARLKLLHRSIGVVSKDLIPALQDIAQTLIKNNFPFSFSKLGTSFNLIELGAFQQDSRIVLYSKFH